MNAQGELIFKKNGFENIRQTDILGKAKVYFHLIKYINLLQLREL